MMGAGNIVLLAIMFVQCSLASYSLSSRQCKYAVKSIGRVLDTKGVSDSLLKGTFVSPRCEWRRIQDTQGGFKTAFLLRSLDIANRRRWTGNYFFYRDQDCTQATYGLKMQGNVVGRAKRMTLNITSVNVAIYSPGIEKEIEMNYNNSCPGRLTRKGSNPIEYVTDSKIFSDKKCLKALGLDQREFIGAFYETHEPAGSPTVELIQKAADLRTSGTMYREQPPLVRHKTRVCLTCAKVGLATLAHPPKLYRRNSTSLDGVWGSYRCQKESRSFYSGRIDKFDGNNFESSYYNMHHTGSQKCESAVFELRTTGTFRMVGNSAEVPGGVVYQMSIKHAFLTPYTAGMTSIFNVGEGTCGSKTWERGKTQDVAVTDGCEDIGFQFSPVELVLIRTVRDENRNEMYFGTGQNKKTGPVEYNYITQDCSTFPIEITTTPGPTEVTTIETKPSTENGATTEQQEEQFNNVIVKNFYSPTDGAQTRNVALTALLFCFLLAVSLV